MSFITLKIECEGDMPTPVLFGRTITVAIPSWKPFEKIEAAMSAAVQAFKEEMEPTKSKGQEEK